MLLFRKAELGLRTSNRIRSVQSVDDLLWRRAKYGEVNVGAIRALGEVLGVDGGYVKFLGGVRAGEAIRELECCGLSGRSREIGDQ